MKIKRRKSSLKRKKVHGFLSRMQTPGGRRVINNRRRKGRKKVAV